MLKPWASLAWDIITIAGGIGTLAAIIFAPRPKIKDVASDLRVSLKSKFLTSILAFIIVFKVVIFVIVGTLVTLLTVRVTGTIPTPAPSITPPVSFTPSPKPTPTIIIGANDVWLDEFPPLLPRAEALKTNEWNSAQDITVSGETYPHSIGFCIPEDDRKKYYEYHDTERITHSEYIEYQLGYKYKTLRFDYGIDDSSFPDNVEYPPQSEFWIVIQTCNSEENLMSDENIVFQTNPLNYRRSLQSSGDIAVSGAEVIRITVFWEFDVISTKPLTFNVALINPILYAVKS
jgi:hypothetical protein